MIIILIIKFQFSISSVQSLSHLWLFVTPWTTAHQASLSITNSQNLLTHVHWLGDSIQQTHPLPSPSPPTFNLSQHQGLFKWGSFSHPRFLSFIVKGCWILLNAFSVPFEGSNDFYLSFYLCALSHWLIRVCCTILASLNKSHLIMVYDSFNVLWSLVS